MSYSSNETSVAAGTPFECYEFETPVGTFRYTSLPIPVTLGGQAYTPRAGLMRSEAEINSLVDSLQSMDFVIPMDDPLAIAYRKRSLPEYCTTRVYRAHYGDDLSTEFSVEWRGEATGYSYTPGGLVIETQSILQAKVQGSQNTIYTQLSCNHRVYDERCSLVKANFTEARAVTKVDDIKITVASLPFGTADLQLGEIRNQRTGETRTIFSVTGTVITVTYPFVDILVGDTVDLTKGCNNLMSTCIDRFDNVINFLGFRYIPLDNIFADSGDKTVVQTTERRTFVPTTWTVTAKFV